MTPEIDETLGCILENLEELVFPHLEEEHALSVARCTSILLRHLILRVRDEPMMLVQDIEEKRGLCAQLAHRLDGAPVDLTAFAIEFAAKAVEPVASTGSLRELTAQNNSQKELLERFIRALHGQKNVLTGAEFSSLQSLVRQQLRAQLNREATLVRVPLGTSTFPY